MKVEKKWYGLMILIGALLWIAVGIIFTLREPGNGQGVYRKTHDLFFVLGIGITMILGTLAHLLWQYRRSHKKLAVVAVINIVGGLTFLAGGILVGIDPGPFPYILFIGFPISALGIILTGVLGGKYKLFSSAVSITIVGMGVCLLFFNDQYMPWMATVLGAAALWLNYRFLYNSHRTPRLEPDAEKGVLSR
jgi:hypothetical protein